MKGLKPNIIKHIGVMENNTLKQLINNIRKYEFVEFMVIGETIQSHTNIKNTIVQYQIKRTKLIHNKSINLL